MGRFGTAIAVGCSGIFIFLMGIAANIDEVTSIFFIDFSKTLSEVGSPTVAVGEIGIVILGLAVLLAGVLALDSA